MGMGWRGGGEDVFEREHLVGRISPGFLVKLNGESVTFGQAGHFRGFAFVAGP